MKKILSVLLVACLLISSWMMFTSCASKVSVKVVPVWLHPVIFTPDLFIYMSMLESSPIAALLNVPASEIDNTELMPTILRKESKDDKYGILDVRVKLKDGEQIDFEMQVEAFDCWANRSVYYLSKMYAG